MNLLTQLLFPPTYTPPPEPQQIICKKDTPLRSRDYGTVMPRTLKAIYEAKGKALSAEDIAASTGIHVESVRRAIRNLVKQGAVQCHRKASGGAINRPALWKLP